MKISFIRHTAVDVAQGVCYGQSDVPLKGTFKQEAQLVLEQLRQVSFDAVYTSPSSRCVYLAEFCGFSAAIKDSRLLELNFGKWELQYWEEISDPHLQVWYQDWVNQTATGGESFNDLYKRFSLFINDLPAQAEQVAIFTHGGIINCARLYAGETTLDRLFEQTPSYGSVTLLDIKSKD